MNLASQVVGAAAATPALIEGDRTVSYDGLAGMVHRARASLRVRSIGPGTRLVLLAPTSVEFVVVVLAALAEGAVVAPLNPLAPAPELAAELAVVEPALLAVGGTGAATVATLAPWAERSVPVESLVASDAETSEAEPADAGDSVGPPIALEASSPAVLLFTSGTAGAPRAAVLTHGSLLANLEQLEAHEVDLVHSGDVVLGALPLFHVLGFNVVLGAALRSGATVVLSDRFDVADALRSVRRHGVTTLVGPPAMWAALVEAPAEFGPDALSTVRLALSGAAPLDPGIARRIEQRYGVSLRQGYGLTEMSPVVSLASPSCPVSSVGTPLPGVEIRLVDEDAADVLVDDVGEVWVRGPNLFSGYLGDDAATAEVLTADGWLRTGDLGVVDRGGRLTIVGRLKDLIVVSGFNVYPAEVEEALVTHQGVVSAAVVGEPDPRTGERVVAHVVTAPGAEVTDDDLRDHVAARLAGYKVPAQFIRVGDLPVGVAGKLRRRELRGQSNVEEGR